MYLSTLITELRSFKSHSYKSTLLFTSDIFFNDAVECHLVEPVTFTSDGFYNIQL